ncbi:MAG: PfkB family carbohydrate kinase [Bacillota bacterium]|nr:PfkB family carbohydrate kinase [Bacillota bacterium]
MHSFGPKAVIATLGENGSIAFDGSKYYECGIVPVKVVDTMGAGDSYIAGFITGAVQKKPLEECMWMGAATASETLRYMGA